MMVPPSKKYSIREVIAPCSFKCFYEIYLITDITSGNTIIQFLIKKYLLIEFYS